MTNLSDLTTPPTDMSTTTTTTTAAPSTAKEDNTKPKPKDPLVQQWYKSPSNDLFVGPVRRKRMPAGRHAVVVSPPAKAEAQLQQGEARKQ